MASLLVWIPMGITMFVVGMALVVYAQNLNRQRRPLVVDPYHEGSPAAVDRATLSLSVLNGDWRNPGAREYRLYGVAMFAGSTTCLLFAALQAL